MSCHEEYQDVQMLLSYFGMVVLTLWLIVSLSIIDSRLSMMCTHWESATTVV